MFLDPSHIRGPLCSTGRVTRTPILSLRVDQQSGVGHLLEVKVSGKLSKEDYERFEPAVEKLITDVGKIKILFVMHDFHGWEVGAV